MKSEKNLFYFQFLLSSEFLLQLCPTFNCKNFLQFLFSIPPNRSWPTASITEFGIDQVSIAIEVQIMQCSFNTYYLSSINAKRL